MERPTSRVSNPIPTKRNLLIIAGQLVAMFAVFYGASVASTGWHVALLAVAFAIVGNSVYSIIHEAEHKKDPDTFKKAISGLKAEFGGISRHASAFKDLEKKLKALKESLAERK